MEIRETLADKSAPVSLLVAHECANFGQSMRSPIDLISALPPGGSTTRWGAWKKAAVVVAVQSGTLGRSEAYERYVLSEEELSRWEEAFGQDGIAGLQAKSLFSRAPRRTSRDEKRTQAERRGGEGQHRR